MKRNEITCNVIVDLLPLYQEGACSEDSKMLIEEHLQTCEECRQLCEHLTIPTVEKQSEPNEAETFQKVSRKLKRSKMTKFMTIVFSVFLVIFAIWNVTWYFLKYRPYHALCSEMQSSDIGKGIQFRTEDAQFSYVVKMPGYLSFSSGFISVSPIENNRIYFDENSAPVAESASYATLFIWPQIKGETEYGVIIAEGNTLYQINIDKSLAFIPYGEQNNNIGMYEKMLAEHRDEIEMLMNAVQNMWGNNLE